MNITGLILAAGSSSRMSKHKQLLTFRGTTLMNDIIEKASILDLKDIICITGHLKDELMAKTSHNLYYLHNIDHQNGLTSSLKLGIRHIKENTTADYALVMLTDQPLIPLVHYRKLIKYAKENHPIVATAYAGTFGVPVIYSRAFFDKILLLDDASSPKKLLSKKSDTLKLVECKEAQFDIDTDNDYQKLLQEYE